jgi:hypothetical protein
MADVRILGGHTENSSGVKRGLLWQEVDGNAVSILGKSKFWEAII